jgi:hypothetical protein
MRILLALFLSAGCVSMTYSAPSGTPPATASGASSGGAKIAPPKPAADDKNDHNKEKQGESKDVAK